MRRSLTAFFLFFMSYSLLAENAISRPEVTWEKGSKTASLHMPTQIDRNFMPNRSRELSTWSVILEDSWGDGWGSGNLTLLLNGQPALGSTYDATGGLVSEFPIEAVGLAGAYLEVFFEVDDHDHLAVTFADPDLYPSEVSFAVYDEFGLQAAVGVAGASPDPFYVDFSYENAFLNSGLEYANPGDEGRPADWGFYPNYNISYEATGNGMWQNENLFQAFDGERSMKIWNTGGENNVFQLYEGDAVPLANTQYAMSAQVATFTGDLLTG